MELRRKIILSFFVVGFVLFLSSLVTIFEMGRIRREVALTISQNVHKINVSTRLLEVTNEYTLSLITRMDANADSLRALPILYSDPRFTEYMATARTDFSDPSEQLIADSVLFAYSAYMQTINQAPQIWETGDVLARRTWYGERLQPVYDRLSVYLQRLVEFEKQRLEKNTVALQAGLYRSMMPGVIAAACGIVLLLLLAYFVLYYVVDPVLKMRLGIKGVLLYKKAYQVKWDSDDELSELNQSVSKLCNEYTNSK